MSFGASIAVFQILFCLVFVGVLAFIVATLARGVRQNIRDDRAPRLSVAARVTGKRADVSHSQHPVAGDATGAHGFHSSTTTWYYATFQVESGDRIELALDARDYAMLAEGDTGILQFQGSRFLGFERDC